LYAKEWGNVDIESVLTQSLRDGVRPILEWSYLPMGFDKEFFLQMQPNFVTHLKLMWHPMLIMPLLVLGAGILQYVVNLLTNVLDLFNKLGFFINLKIHMCRFFLLVA